MFSQQPQVGSWVPSLLSLSRVPDTLFSEDCGLVETGHVAILNVQPGSLKFGLLLSIGVYNWPAWTVFRFLSSFFPPIQHVFNLEVLHYIGLRICCSSSKAGVKMILPIGFHEEDVRQFFVPFAISLHSCPLSLSQVCIIWTVIEPIRRGAMTSG